jgi:hypothetical protein
MHEERKGTGVTLSSSFTHPFFVQQSWGFASGIIKRGKTYAKAVKLVYDGGFCCKKREKRLTGIPIKASEPFHPFK